MAFDIRPSSASPRSNHWELRPYGAIGTFQAHVSVERAIEITSSMWNVRRCSVGVVWTWYHLVRTQLQCPAGTFCSIFELSQATRGTLCLQKLAVRAVLRTGTFITTCWIFTRSRPTARAHPGQQRLGGRASDVPVPKIRVTSYRVTVDLSFEITHQSVTTSGVAPSVQ